MKLKDKYNNNVLHLLCQNEAITIPIIEFVISKDININETNNEYLTPLQILCSHSSISLPLIECLIKHGADIKKAKKKNETPLNIILSNPNVSLNIIKKLTDEEGVKNCILEAVNNRNIQLMQNLSGDEYQEIDENSNIVEYVIENKVINSFRSVENSK